MKRFAAAALLLVSIALVAAASCWLMGQVIGRSDSHHDDTSAAHLWVHQHLELTGEQEKNLMPLEREFTSERKRLTAAIRSANARLATAIREDREDSPRVRAAVMEIHDAQGELQNVVLKHVFDMHEFLTAEQYDKLLTLTAGALDTPSDD